MTDIQQMLAIDFQSLSTAQQREAIAYAEGVVLRSIAAGVTNGTVAADVALRIIADLSAGNVPQCFLPKQDVVAPPNEDLVQPETEVGAVVAEEKQGYIYFVHSPESARVKIGYTTDPDKRIYGLQTASPSALEALAIITGTVVDERELHRRFAHLRVHREWFRDCDELREYIATLE